MDENNAPELRGRMYAELAQFVAPKLKAIEHSGDAGQTYVARLPELCLDLDEWNRRYTPNGSGVANGNRPAHGS